jgi:hypothetical protein
MFHHQPINVPTAGAQAFLCNSNNITWIDDGIPTRRTGHNPPRGPSADWWVTDVYLRNTADVGDKLLSL